MMMVVVNLLMNVVDHQDVEASFQMDPSYDVEASFYTYVDVVVVNYRHDVDYNVVALILEDLTFDDVDSYSIEIYKKKIFIPFISFKIHTWNCICCCWWGGNDIWDGGGSWSIDFAMYAKFELVNEGPLPLWFDDKDGGLGALLFDELFDELYGELADCKLFVICSILLNGGAIFDVGVLGPPFISNGSSLANELLFESINGDDKLLFPVNLAGRGDAADTLCGVRCEDGPCERWVGVVEPTGCCPDDNGFILLFGVEVERVNGVIGSSLHDDDDDGSGGPPLIPFGGR
jgi:hypothetical protein